MKVATVLATSSSSDEVDHGEIDDGQSSLCDLCTQFERQALVPATKSIEYVEFKHHQSFRQLAVSAGSGCRLCRVLEQGLLRLNQETSENEGDELRSLDELRYYLMQQDEGLLPQQVQASDRVRSRTMCQGYRIHLNRREHYIMSATGLQPRLSFASLEYCGHTARGCWREPAVFMLCTDAGMCSDS